MANPLYQTIASQLQALGLGALAPVTGDGEPAGWLADQLRQGYDTVDELMLNLQQTDIFRQRFSAITEQQARAAKGEPVYVMSPAEVIQYERTATQLMRAANMPAWFYDQPSDFADLMRRDVSPKELEERIVQSYEYVQNAPPEVRQKFSEYYGVAQGDAALAAYILDPERTTANLERARRAAYTGGMAQRYDIALSQAASERIAQLPQTEGGITAGLEQIAQLNPLFDENLFEGNDLSAEHQGVQSTFEGNSAATTAIERRRIQRQAPARATTGGAAQTQRGVVGAGSASY
jgi:hypothetical protein